ncbi:MAG: NAD(P)/FAD-dependent oxidoreductase [Alphaproteobacteria bacterium]|nr:NAD(P)/FAD-dependent oxidoreductase [Alphaproteobacteria bacterium]
MKPRLVVIGNGMAGMRAVEELLLRAPDHYDITVFGAEPNVNYNRIMLSPLLAGEKSFADIIINGRGWYAENHITLHMGAAIALIDRDAREVVGACGIRTVYDRLLIATGSDPFILPIPGVDLPGVVTFRDVLDVKKMLAASRTGQRAVVIGGGLLGLEAANGLRANGMQVSVVHLMPTLMERQLDEAAGYLLQRELESRGIEIFTRANSKEIYGVEKAGGILLEDGRRINADLIVMAVGIKPSIALARACGLLCERGIVVDDHMVTSDPAILAVGECVQHQNTVYGLVAPLFDMAKVVAAQLSDDTASAYRGSVTNTRLKVSGIDLFSAGDFSHADGVEDIVLRDAYRGVYKRLVLRENRIRDAVLYGDTGDGGWYFQMLRDGRDISAIHDSLIFGQSFASGDTGKNPSSAVAALPDSAEICGCNGVCKGKIVTAIQTHALGSLEEVRTKTKASASCGSCAGLVEQLLQLTLGESYKAGAAIKPLCKCTDLSHDDVRRLILAKELKSIPAVMQELQWNSANGCSACRPALNYYLVCAWPGEYADDYQSRFINERAHANIQKDGTYSVVPRMWGGLTNARELRAIADAVDKFNIPAVKVTGGQRIDLLGVRKEQLPEVWKDLNAAGMVSGHAYGKALRTVKTCVGSEWCRFGTQASMSIGVMIEKMAWGSWTPHKVKMAVSGCPRNCAEATIKDFGVIAVDSGWELHVGGNGGIRVRVTDLLCKVETEAEVLEYCGAFMQLYREEAHYLERTAPWLERVGLAHVQEKIVTDAASRARLYARFLIAQKYSQDDPWAERASNGVHAHEFRSLEMADQMEQVQ